MAKVTFKRTSGGLLDGKPFPKAGETVEVPDALVPALTRLRYLETEPAADATVTEVETKAEAETPETPNEPAETADARETREVAAPEKRGPGRPRNAVNDN